MKGTWSPLAAACCGCCARVPSGIYRRRERRARSGGRTVGVARALALGSRVRARRTRPICPHAAEGVCGKYKSIESQTFRKIIGTRIKLCYAFPFEASIRSAARAHDGAQTSRFDHRWTSRIMCSDAACSASAPLGLAGAAPLLALVFVRVPNAMYAPTQVARVI